MQAVKKGKVKEFVTNTHQKFRISIPKIGEEHTWEWYPLPQDVYQHKTYPVCKCGRRYVRIKGNKCPYCKNIHH